MDSGLENLSVSEDESVDEAVPIYIRKERRTKSYKETMSQDIDNIDPYETRTNVNTKKWRSIYEVIYKTYIKNSKLFSENFIK